MAIMDTPNSLFISSPLKSTSRVGQDILSYCNRCKMNLSHTIVTIGVNSKPDKVQCNTCKSEKQYRPPKSEGRVPQGVHQLPLSMQTGTTEDIAHYEARLSAQKNNISQAKAYKATIRFKPGEIISHKSFGIGFVIAENGLNKIEVLFPKGRKLLATGLTLEDG